MTDLAHAPSYSANIATAHALHSAGKLKEAGLMYQHILEHDPNHADAWHYWGVLAWQSGDSALAQERISHAIRIKPASAMYANLGSILAAGGAFDAAITSYQRALVLDPLQAGLHLNLGRALGEIGQFEQAIACYTQSISLEPNLADAYFSLGEAQRRLGHLDAAYENLLHALALPGNHALIYNALGMVQRAWGRLADAGESYQRALAIRPDLVPALINLANVLADMGKLEAAIAFYRRAVEHNPAMAEAHLGLGRAQHALGWADAALASYRQALTIKPAMVEAELNMSLLLLYMGRLEEGWQHYQVRTSPYLTHGVQAPDLPFPRWQGEPLADKTLLIWPEQGMGDEIQFCRYTALLKAQGTRHITWVCKPALARLLRHVSGIDHVVSIEEAPVLPVHDYWSLPLDLPLYCATTLTTIPCPVSYVHPEPAAIAALAPSIASLAGLKVGIVWSAGKSYVPGSGAERTLALKHFIPLFATPGVHFFTLQPGSRDEFLAHAGSSGVDLGHEIDADTPPFIETAALIAQLDLVIACDGAVAHVAGAMGKPVWLLLPYVSDWRWLSGREDSLWYPATRLYRQHTFGQWDDVFHRIQCVLQQKAFIQAVD